MFAPEGNVPKWKFLLSCDSCNWVDSVHSHSLTAAQGTVGVRATTHILIHEGHRVDVC